MQGFSLIAGVNLQYICCSGITQYGKVVNVIDHRAARITERPRIP